MVYRLALGTGFRAKELRILTPASFDLDANPPTVKVSAAHTKRGRKHCQPIRRDLAELLRSGLAGRLSDEPLLAKLPESTARMLRCDLAGARTEWVDEAPTDRERATRKASDFLKYRDSAGKVFDFHSTRHTYISGIVAGNASVKVAQELARHSTPVLTIGRYSHTRLHDLRGALDSLPSLIPTSPSPETQREVLGATGTDDARVHPQAPLPGKWAHQGQQLNGETGQNAASDGKTVTKMTGEVDKAQLPVLSADGEKRQGAAKDEKRGAGGIRTREWRICNPLP